MNSALIAELHMDLLKQATDSLNENGMDITMHKGGKLSGTITVGDSHKIITSIPYDAGWTVKIDGKKAPVTKFADTFLVAEAESGKHEITFSYVSPGFKTGILFFILSIVMVTVYASWDRICGRFHRAE